MRNQTAVVASAALLAITAISCTIAFLVFGARTEKNAEPVAQTGPVLVVTAKPQPTVTVTVTVTKQKTVRKTVIERPHYYGSADGAFLSAIARDGIRAPDDWAVEAGRETCGTSYAYAYDYLTDAGIYSYHVQPFLDDWVATHGGC